MYEAVLFLSSEAPQQSKRTCTKCQHVPTTALPFTPPMAARLKRHSAYTAVHGPIPESMLS